MFVYNDKEVLVDIYSPDLRDQTMNIKARNDGIESGMKMGGIKSSIEAARIMKRNGYDVSEIAYISGLRETRVKKYIKKLD